MDTVLCIRLDVLLCEFKCFGGFVSSLVGINESILILRVLGIYVKATLSKYLLPYRASFDVNRDLRAGRVTQGPQASPPQVARKFSIGFFDFVLLDILLC